MQIYTDSDLAAIWQIYHSDGNSASLAALKTAAVEVATDVAKRLGTNEDGRQAAILAALEALQSWTAQTGCFGDVIGSAARYAVLRSHTNTTSPDPNQSQSTGYEAVAPNDTEMEVFMEQLIEQVNALSEQDRWIMRSYFGLQGVPALTVPQIASVLNIGRSKAYRTVNDLLASMGDKIAGSY